MGITSQLRAVVALMRPHQWLKNLFIFLPMFFDRHLTDVRMLGASVLAFVAYSLAASGIYCFNDIWDAEADKLHPEKCKRPVACGLLSKGAAGVLALVCFVAAIATPLTVDLIGGGNRLIAILLIYILLNLAYCMKLKQIALVDVFIIAAGFDLRILAGGAATGVYLSHWIVLMTFLLALFLAFAKRRDDVVLYNETGQKARKNVNRYTLDFMNQAISVVASVTMVCYIMYTVSEEVVQHTGSPYLYITAVFVLAGLMRYLQLTIVDVKSGSPTKVLMRDRFVQACVAGWVLTFIVILYV